MRTFVQNSASLFRGYVSTFLWVVCAYCTYVEYTYNCTKVGPRVALFLEKIPSAPALYTLSMGVSSPPGMVLGQAPFRGGVSNPCVSFDL